MAGNTIRPGVSVSSRLLALLAAFDPEHRRLTLTELARRADVPLTTAHRLVRELVTWGALAPAPSGGYVVGRRLYGEDHWILEWTMVLSLAEPDGSPFTAQVEMLDVVQVNARGEVTRKDVYMNGKQSQAAFARAGIER